MTYLVDTNVVSEVRKRRPDARVLAWWDTVDSTQLFLSALTIGEIRLGIERRRGKDPAQAEVFEAWLAGIRTTYNERIVDIDCRVAEEWGRLNAPAKLPVIDGLLASTAKTRGWTLVTRNTADLAGSGVQLLNPFEWPGSLPT